MLAPLGTVTLIFFSRVEGWREKKKAKCLFWMSFSKISSPTEMKA